VIGVKEPQVLCGGCGRYVVAPDRTLVAGRNGDFYRGPLVLGAIGPASTSASRKGSLALRPAAGGCVPASRRPLRRAGSSHT
jgi:hypothetical protein